MVRWVGTNISAIFFGQDPTKKNFAVLKEEAFGGSTRGWLWSSSAHRFEKRKLIEQDSKQHSRKTTQEAFSTWQSLISLKDRTSGISLSGPLWVGEKKNQSVKSSSRVLHQIEQKRPQTKVTKQSKDGHRDDGWCSSMGWWLIYQSLLKHPSGKWMGLCARDHRRGPEECGGSPSDHR